MISARDPTAIQIRWELEPNHAAKVRALHLQIARVLLDEVFGSQRPEARLYAQVATHIDGAVDVEVVDLGLEVVADVVGELERGELRGHRDITRHVSTADTADDRYGRGRLCQLVADGAGDISLDMIPFHLGEESDEATIT